MRDAKFFERYIDYRPETGEFYYKPRSESEFSSKGEFKRWNNRYANKPAGGFYVRPDGYKMLRIRVCWGRYTGSRIAAVICGLLTNYGDYGQIDHIDGDPSNNRIQNLRIVDDSINSKNRKMRSNNSSGVTGVQKVGAYARWKARISDDGEDVNLGVFEDFFEAVCARRSAELQFNYSERHGR